MILVPAKVPTKSRPAILQASPLKKLPWLVHAFSTRASGNLGFTKDASRRTIERNRATFIKTLTKGKPWPLVTLRQIHSDLIHCVTGVPSHQLAGDGLITRTPGLLLAIQTADCLPVILVDAKRHAIGVFHAGWRGTVQRIVEKGVGEMRRYFGTQPRDIQATIGPGVHNCCYQVGQEVRDRFESQFAYASDLFHETKESDEVHERYPLLFLTARAPGHSEDVLPKKIFLDLVEANRRQLIDTGVPAKHITTSPHCTSCRTDLLFSYRKEKDAAGRLLAVAGIKPH
jgi:polyphenol oxidase